MQMAAERAAQAWRFISAIQVSSSKGACRGCADHELRWGALQLSAGCGGLDVLTSRCGSLQMSPAAFFSLVLLSLFDLLADPKRTAHLLDALMAEAATMWSLTSTTALSGLEWRRESEPVEALGQHFLEEDDCF